MKSEEKYSNLTPDTTIKKSRTLYDSFLPLISGVDFDPRRYEIVHWTISRSSVFVFDLPDSRSFSNLTPDTTIKKSRTLYDSF